MRLYLLALGMTLIAAACASSSAKDNANPKDDTYLKTGIEVPATEAEAETDAEPGGKDADDLGRKVIAAFKKNDVKAYLACIHGEDKAKSAKEFEAMKENLAADGVADWSKVKYSRVTYSQNPPLSYFRLEFDYGTSYSGIMSGTAGLKHEGRYYLDHAFINAGLFRKQ